MLVQPKPKPTHRKAQRDKVQKIKFERGYCYNCHSTYWLEPHHIYGGNPDRQHSERYGLVVDLCHDCHLSVTDEKDQDLISRLQQDGQRRFEAVHGADKFKAVFGRNYL
jgi:hypothetical protein